MKFLEELLKDVELEGKEEIISKVKDHVAKTYVPKSDFNSKNEELKGLKEQIEERDKQLEVLGEKAKSNKELTTQIETLKEENIKTKEELETRIAQLNKSHEIEKAISSSEFGFLDAEIVKSLIKEDDIKINDDGVIGLREQLEAIATEKPFLCKKEDKESEEDGIVPNIVTGKKKNDKITADDFFKMPTMERMKLKSENESLYNQLMNK